MIRDGGVPIRLPPLDERPLVSVLVTSYNYARFIGAALESVLSQSYDHFELIVCDDGSKDDSCAVVIPLAQADGRVRLIRKENGGHASALNRAYAESSGQIICILDADDLFAPDKLRKVVAAFRSDPGCGLVTHHLRIIDASASVTGRLVCGAGGELGPDIATLRLGHRLPLSSGLSFRRTVIGEVMPLPEARFRSAADWALAYAAACLTRTLLIPDDLGYYRIHGSNLSGTTSTAPRLDAEFIGRTLSGMERVIEFVDEFSRRRVEIPVPASRVRNVLEHRLMLGLLTDDRELVLRTRRDLREAFRSVRRDYPRSRYGFWMGLSAIPGPLSRFLLHGAFQSFRVMRRLSG